jgi:two-component system sensor histidine kinase RpfC
MGRLRARQDSEHEMSLNRLVFAAIIVIILLVEAKGEAPGRALIGMMAYVVLALAVLGHIMLVPGICHPRRIFALLLDCIFLSWQLHLGGENVALFYTVYLWVIFGNGFRFGVAYLAAAVTVATSCFAVVVATTPFWNKQLDLSFGLLIGLVILPAYTGTLIRKLSAATLAAEEASKAKSLFLASVSHELRTPLTAIVGMSGLLRAGPLDEDQREMIETVDVATRSLQSLINGLLDLSRIEAGRMPNMAEELDLLNLLADVRRMVESQVRTKHLRFDIHVTPRTPLLLLASRQHLHEILVNLAGNAVKFTESGGVVIAVDGYPAEGTETGVTLNIEVSDTGIGIAPEDQARIFDDFTQANGAIMNRFGGTGLGLAITRRRVALLGGRIEVESKLGAGSVFRLSIRTEAAARTMEPALANRAHVILAARNPAVAARLQAGLHAIGATVTLLDTSRGVALPPAVDGVRRILLVHAPDFQAMEAVRAAVAPAIVLVDETMAPVLPDIATQRCCVALLSETYSAASLGRALMIALGLAGTPSSQPADAGATADVEILPAPRSLQRRRVLLVDDNRVNQRVFSRILESAGHEVLLADNGEMALDVLEREADRLDIVLMDFNMPELDGLEATKMYRMMSSGQAHLPIIGLTADATAQSDDRWRNAGMDGCLIKPVDPPAFLAAIQSMARSMSPLSAAQVTVLHDHPRFRKAAIPAFDETIVANLRQLGDNIFTEELMLDFLSDAAEIIDALIEAARQGDTVKFRNQAHGLRSSAVNVGAVMLADMCKPWVGRRGSELQAQSGAFASRAQAELMRTREAVDALSEERRAQSL